MNEINRKKKKNFAISTDTFSLIYSTTDIQQKNVLPNEKESFGFIIIWTLLLETTNILNFALESLHYLRESPQRSINKFTLFQIDLLAETEEKCLNIEIIPIWNWFKSKLLSKKLALA